MKNTKNILLLILLVIISFGIKKMVRVKDIEESKPETLLKMVFVPASEKGDENDFASLLKIVEESTGYKIETVKVTDYNAAVESMRSGQADMGWFGASSYIEATKIADVEAFAVGIPKGKEKAFYNTHFIVLKDSPVEDFTKEQIQGLKLALNHIGSTSGDLIPRYELFQIDLDTTDPDDFEVVQYAGSHDAAILAVLNGLADVAGVSSVNWEARIKDGTILADDFRVIHSSEPIQGAPLVYSKNLSDEVRSTIKEAVLHAHEQGEIGGYGGQMEMYVQVKDGDYDPIRKVSETFQK
jgi:phosphonate transport system substrate-binding protein